MSVEPCVAMFGRTASGRGGRRELMTPKSPASLLEPLTELAIAAGLAIRAIAAGDIGLREKADRSPVTAADIAADRLIADGLGRIAPDVPLISEESAARTPPGSCFFLVDPLDGTREFAAGRDEYTVNIALIAEGRPILGIVAAPARLMLWRGGMGLGAERIETDAGGGVLRRTPIHTRPRPAVEWVAAISRSHRDPATGAFLEKLGIVRQVVAGSALKLCLVAEGSADVYPRFGPTSEWDNAAGHAVVEAAGGAVTTPGGGGLVYGGQDGSFRVNGFIAWGDPAAVRPATDERRTRG